MLVSLPPPPHHPIAGISVNWEEKGEAIDVECLHCNIGVTTVNLKCTCSVAIVNFSRRLDRVSYIYERRDATWLQATRHRFHSILLVQSISLSLGGVSEDESLLPASLLFSFVLVSGLQCIGTIRCDNLRSRGEN